jgi:amidophosphoribosyltransferase
MCWVGAIVSLQGAIDAPGDLARSLLLGNKNRGQDGYGLSLRCADDQIHTFKFPDITPDLVARINQFSGQVTALISHARYPTSGGNGYKPKYVQPFEETSASPRYAFAFNGNIVNAPELADGLAQDGYQTEQQPLLDTEVLKLMIQQQIDRWVGDHKVILEHINDRVDGCCNMILLAQQGNVSLAKDRRWFRPLAFAQNEKLFVASSESAVLFKMWLEHPTFMKAGEMVQVTPKQQSVHLQTMDLLQPIVKSRCFFEAVYFANPMTLLRWTPSNAHRYRLGQELAKHDMHRFDEKNTVVVDVPASAYYSAKWYNDMLNVPHIPAIIKSPDAKRTFIETDEKREKMIQEKYLFSEQLIPHIQNKIVVLLDDSIVRGATMEHLVHAFREFYQPAEVHLRIPSPPIVAPCFYGINIARRQELIAPQFFQDELHPTPTELTSLANYFHAESIQYISPDGLADALRVGLSDICLWCITGKYPTPYGQEAYDRQCSGTLCT